jgi:hypothetical protein
MSLIANDGKSEGAVGKSFRPRKYEFVLLDGAGEQRLSACGTAFPHHGDRRVYG